MNPVGNTSGKSCDNDLQKSKNRQGRLADLGPSNPSPPRVAADAHQLPQRPEEHFFAMHPATPGGHGANNGQAQPRQENPLLDVSREHIAHVLGGALEAPFGQAAMTSWGESADLLDSVVNSLLSDDCEVYDPQDPNLRVLMADYEATFLGTGAAPTTPPAQPHPPVGGSPGPGAFTGQTGATPFGKAPAAPSVRAIVASGGESADLLDSVAHSLLSDDYAAYDPEASNVRAMMADYEATMLDTGAPPSIDPDTGQIGAAVPAGALEAPCGGESSKRPAESSAAANHARKKKRARAEPMLMTAAQRKALLHIFETDPNKSNRDLADEFGIPIAIIRRLRKKFNKTGNVEPGDFANRLTEDQRQSLAHIFETDPRRSIQSIADEFGVSYFTISVSRKQFDKTGNLKPGHHGNRLSDEQRQAILHAFATDTERNNQSLMDEFGVSLSTIKRLRRKFDSTGQLKRGDNANRLSADQRRALSHILNTNPERNNQSIADEVGVSSFTVAASRRQLGKTGRLKPGDYTKRLSADQRQALLHVFETDPERSNRSLVDEFGIAYTTLLKLKKQFGKTGHLKPKDHPKPLSADQRRALLHIFKTDPKRSNQSIVDEFGVSYSTIHILKEKFSKTGNLKPGDSTNRLTEEQRRALSHVFETDPKRSSQSLANEFGVNPKTVRILRRRFNETGNLKAGYTANRLTDDQRRAILHVFETDSKKSRLSLANELGVSISTIKLLRKRFNKTGNITPGNRGNRLSADQRQAAWRIFETDPERSNQSLADEFGVSNKTIGLLRKQFGQI